MTCPFAIVSANEVKIAKNEDVKPIWWYMAKFFLFEAKTHVYLHQSYGKLIQLARESTITETTDIRDSSAQLVRDSKWVEKFSVLTIPSQTTNLLR